MSAVHLSVLILLSLILVAAPLPGEAETKPEVKPLTGTFYTAGRLVGDGGTANGIQVTTTSSFT